MIWLPSPTPTEPVTIVSPISPAPRQALECPHCGGVASPSGADVERCAACSIAGRVQADEVTCEDVDDDETALVTSFVPGRTEICGRSDCEECYPLPDRMPEVER